VFDAKVFADHLHKFWGDVAREKSQFHSADAPWIAGRRHMLAADRAPEPFFGGLDKARVFALTFNPHHPGGPADLGWKAFCYRMMVGDCDWTSFVAAADSSASTWLARNTGRFAERSFDGIANLRLFAYPSREMSSLGEVRSVLQQLPSVRMMKSIVHDILVPSAKSGEICLLVMRSSEEWGFGRVTTDLTDGGLFISRPLRAASISPGSRVGHLIEQFLA